jgi:hypothetical protein
VKTITGGILFPARLKIPDALIVDLVAEGWYVQLILTPFWSPATISSDHSMHRILAEDFMFGVRKPILKDKFLCVAMSRATARRVGQL